MLNQPVWVRVENAPRAAWIAAEAVRFGASKEVGIRFFRPCPPNFFSGTTVRESIPRVDAGEEETVDLDEMRSESWRVLE